MLAALLLAHVCATRPAEASLDVTPSGFGSSVALCGDLDGDGRSEFAIGGRAHPGCAASILIYSGRSGEVMRRIEPVLAGSRMSDSYCRTKDMDGDGVDDMVLSCRWNDGKRGRVEVRSGLTGGVLHTLDALEDEFQFSTGITDIGDTDGDGFDDLVVSGHMAPWNEPWSGARWILFSGATSERLQVLDWEGPPQREWNSTAWNPAAIALGDVDGDRVPDFALIDGVYVRVQSGARSKMIYRLELPEQRARYGFRYSICGGVDLNCDGRNEIFVGTPFVNGENWQEPQVYVSAYDGVGCAPLLFIARWGAERGFGFGLQAAPDMDRDGIPDLWVTQCTNFSPGLYLVSGRDGSELRRVPCTDHPWALAGGADVDADGVDDLIVGEHTPYASDSAWSGAFVISGKDARILHRKLASLPIPGQGQTVR